MDIERQFEAAFSKITLDNGQPLVSVEPEIVHGCVVNNDLQKSRLFCRKILLYADHYQHKLKQK